MDSIKLILRWQYNALTPMFMLGRIVSVVSQAYAVNLMEEYVLRGNAAILKCHIPSFVSEYVTVVSWIISEGEEEVEIKLVSDNNLEGMNFALAYNYFFKILSLQMLLYCLLDWDVYHNSAYLSPWASRPTSILFLLP